MRGKEAAAKPVTVTILFITNDGTDHGKLTEVKQFYTQDGWTIEHSSYTANGNQHSTITEDFCADLVAVTQDGTTFFSFFFRIENFPDASIHQVSFAICCRQDLIDALHSELRVV